MKLTSKEARKLLENERPKFEDQRWKLFDYYITSSQEASSRLIWEREQCLNGVFDLTIIDNRPYFTMV